MSGGGSLGGAATVGIVVADVTAPVISSIGSSGITSSTATITWTTDELANSQICRGVQGGPYNTCVALNSALTLSHSELFTGLSQSTTYYFVVKSADNFANLATSSEQTFATIAPPVGSGPPDYLSANYTTGIYSETGNSWSSAWFTSNTTFTEPIFGTALVGVTRALACPDAAFDQITVPDSTNINIFNYDSSRVIVRALTSSSSYIWIPLNFDTTTRQFSRVAGDGGRCNGSGAGLDFRITGGFSVSEPAFGFLAPPNDRVYGTASGAGNIIRQYTFDETVTAGPNSVSCTGTSCTSTAHGAAINNYIRLAMGEIRRITATPTADTFTVISAFTANPSGSAWNKVVVGGTAGFADIKNLLDANCDPTFGTTSGSLLVSADDDVFVIAGAGAGQDQFTHFTVWSRTKGCRWLDTVNGTVSNGVGATWSGPTGAITGSVRAKIHSTEISKDGKFVRYSIQNCTADCTNPGNVFWEINTVNVTHNHNNATELGGAHSATCYDSHVNGPNRSDMTEVYWRSLTNLTPYRRMSGLSGYFGERYNSCNNSRSVGTASVPSLVSFYRVTNLGTTISQRKWDNEITMAWGGDTTVPEKVARFAKTCASVSSSFATNRPRAVVSQDGRFAAFSTDGSNCGLAGQPWMFTVVRLD